MKKFVTFASDVRVNALLACSAAVLLTACGGGIDAGNGQHTQTAGYVQSSETAVSGAEAVATADAAGEQAAQGAAGFDLVGYESNPLLATPELPADVAAAQEQDAGLVAPADAAAAAGPTRLLAATVAVSTPKTSYNFYVSPSGSDTNAGTQAKPFKTIQRAAKAATRASTTVWVAPGTYNGGIKTTANGTSSSRIYYVSTTKHGAKIVPPSGSTMKQAWDNRGNYVNIVGFNVDGADFKSGTKWTNGIYMGGSYGVVQENRVHHIALNIPCTSGGGSAIGSDSYFKGVWNDVISNQVHDIGPKGCKYVQGIYISTSGSVKNNQTFRAGDAAIHLWHDANNVTITNNTVTQSRFGVIVGGGDFYHRTTGADNVKVYSNIIYDNTYGISEMGKTGKNNAYSNNLIFKNTTPTSLRNGLTAKNTIAKEPLFVNYSRSVYMPNFKLTSASPAIGKGISSGAHSTDYDGRPRNSSTGYTIGAYQH